MFLQKEDERNREREEQARRQRLCIRVTDTGQILDPRVQLRGIKCSLTNLPLLDPFYIADGIYFMRSIGFILREI